jgi:cytochrome c-type biogenesis protein CcmH/NrfG
VPQDRMMGLSWKMISGSPAILLLAGFSVGAALTTSLILGVSAFVAERDPFVDVLLKWQSPPLRSSAYLESGLARMPTTLQQAALDTPGVASLNELLPGLEAKVAANPDDPDLQMLLVQTYLELEQHGRAKELLERFERSFPQHEGISFVRAKLLMESDAASDLLKAIHLFEENARRHPDTLYLARLYQGQMLVKLGDKKRAIRIWQEFISALPPGDERRASIETELAKTISAE